MYTFLYFFAKVQNKYRKNIEKVNKNKAAILQKHDAGSSLLLYTFFCIFSILFLFFFCTFSIIVAHLVVYFFCTFSILFLYFFCTFCPLPPSPPSRPVCLLPAISRLTGVPQYRKNMSLRCARWSRECKFKTGFVKNRQNNNIQQELSEECNSTLNTARSLAQNDAVHSRQCTCNCSGHLV